MQIPQFPDLWFPVFFKRRKIFLCFLHSWLCLCSSITYPVPTMLLVFGRADGRAIQALNKVGRASAHWGMIFFPVRRIRRTFLWKLSKLSSRIFNVRDLLGSLLVESFGAIHSYLLAWPQEKKYVRVFGMTATAGAGTRSLLYATRREFFKEVLYNNIVIITI